MVKLPSAVRISLKADVLMATLVVATCPSEKIVSVTPSIGWVNCIPVSVDAVNVRTG